MAFSEEEQEGLARLIAARFPDTPVLQSLERLSGGASQETYRLELSGEQDRVQVCMRRAPGGVTVADTNRGPGVGAEADIIRAVYAANVPVPEIYHSFQPEDGLGEGYLMQWLEGETLGSRIIKSPGLAAVRPSLAFECGSILGRIHSVDVDASGLSKQLAHLPPKDFVEQTWTRYKVLAAPYPMIDYTARWLLENLPVQSRMTLVHNDFRNGNLMVSSKGVVAVLDWELAHIGDPMRDLGWLCTNSWRFGNSTKPVGGFGDYADLFAGYEAGSGLKVNPDEVHFWEVFGSFWWAMGTLEMAVAGRDGAEQSVERPAIGRRSSECQVDCVNKLIPGPVPPLEVEGPPDIGEIARVDEIINEVAAYLRDDVVLSSSGRARFLARVAANSLDIVAREWQVGARARQREQCSLASLLNESGSLEHLRWRLCEQLRGNDLPLNTTGLAEHLRQTVADQVAIDQPDYSGCRDLLGAGGADRRK